MKETKMKIKSYGDALAVIKKLKEENEVLWGIVEEQRKEISSGYHDNQDFVRQLMQDLTMVYLSQECGFSKERNVAYAYGISDLWCKYADIWNSDTKDMEYSYATLDAALREALNGDIVPAEQRYAGHMYRNKKAMEE